MPLRWAAEHRSLALVISDLDAAVPPQHPPAVPPSGPPSSAPPAAAAAARSLASEGFALEFHLAPAPSSAARDATRTGLVIAHGLPNGPGSALTAGQTFPQLADRVADDTGWTALSFCFRGAGRSEGWFSPGGWLQDLTAAVELLRADVSSVWLAGFGLGGTLALRMAALDPAVGGVAALAAPSDLLSSAWDPAELAVQAHRAGLIRSATPPDLDEWGPALRAIDPIRSARAVPPRPLLIVHGSADETVPLLDARALADAAEGAADLRVIPMAGHRLRHDPRAIALLLGWLERRDG